MPRVYGYPEDGVIIDSHRDSYSTELATIFMGANSHDSVMRHYRQCLRALHIQLGDRDEIQLEDHHQLSA